MPNKTESLADIFAEEEARRVDEARAEKEAEDARIAAMSDEEREAVARAYEERFGHLDDLVDADEDEDEEE